MLPEDGLTEVISRTDIVLPPPWSLISSSPRQPRALRSGSGGGGGGAGAFAGGFRGWAQEGGGRVPGCRGLRYGAFTRPVAVPARRIPLSGTLMCSGRSSLLCSLLAAVPVCLQTFPPSRLLPVVFAREENLRRSVSV